MQTGGHFSLKMTVFTSDSRPHTYLTKSELLPVFIDVQTQYSYPIKIFSFFFIKLSNLAIITINYIKMEHNKKVVVHFYFKINYKRTFTSPNSSVAFDF